MIKISNEGEFTVTDGNGKGIRELSSKELGDSLIGREIKNARSVNVCFLDSNPIWVCVGGVWYCIG